MVKRLVLLAAVPALLPALLLGGCKKADDTPKAAAGGELLDRSVTDDMLPYDTVQSQASLSAPDAGLVSGPRRAGPETDATAIPEEDAAVPVVTPPPAEPPTPAAPR